MGHGFASGRGTEGPTPENEPPREADGLQPYGNAAAIEALGTESRPVGQAPGGVLRLLEAASDIEPLASIARADGSSEDLSGVDWFRRRSEVPDLPLALRATGAPDAAQEAIWFLFEATSQDPDPQRQRVYDLRSGAIRSEPIPVGVDPIDVAVGSNLVQTSLTSQKGIIDNKVPPTRWSDEVDPVGGTTRESFGGTVDRAIAARATLRERFGFDPDVRSLGAVRAVRGQFGADQFQPFIDAYLTAFFVNGAPPGAGLHYDLGSMGPVNTFFGDPPGCDQLPDGRGIIDCKGFSAVSELLLKELAGGRINQSGDSDVSLPFTLPHHQMVLLRSGSRVMAVDNDDVVPLDMSAVELAEIDRLAQSRFEPGRGCDAPRTRPLSGPIDLGALPTLAVFLEKVRADLGLPPSARANWYDALEVGLGE